MLVLNYQAKQQFMIIFCLFFFLRCVCYHSTVFHQINGPVAMCLIKRGYLYSEIRYMSLFLIFMANVPLKLWNT